MSTEFNERLQAVDETLLIPLVRAVVENESAEVVDWAIELILGGATQALGRSYGLYRFKGTAHIQDKCVPWSLILKAKARSLEVGQEPKHWNYWKRKILAYQSGLLADLPGNIVAPRCFGVIEYPGDEFWIWLEDIPSESESTWPLKCYGLAAHHLGQFNGAYLIGEYPLPKEPWLSEGRVRNWLDRSEAIMPDLPELSQHPLAKHWFKGDSADRTLQLWQKKGVLLDTLDRLPRTFCHHDAFRRNLIFRAGTERQDQTVAIDWEIVGLGAIGEEIATLVGISLLFRDFPGSQARALDSIVFEGYMDVLRDAGWKGNERLVRFGFAATAALFIGVVAVGPFMANLLDDDRKAVLERFYGCSREDLADQYALMQNYLLDLGDEAYALIDILP